MSRWVSVLITAFLLVGEAWGAPGESFEGARFVRPLNFPSDHGEHRSFETEWWYVTGQLKRGDEKIFGEPADYGFLLVFFRRAVDASRTGTAGGQVYLAHAALTDRAGNAFHFERRLSGGALGAAGAAENFLRVWHLDWLAEAVAHRLVLHSSVGEGSRVLRLISEPLGSPLLHGKLGLSAKDSCAGCASYYYSVPRIELSGQIEEGGALVPVRGLAWLDHEFMTNALSRDQAGWDWLSLMFEDGTDLMLFRVRSLSGEPAFVSGTVRRGDKTSTLGDGEFAMTPVRSWDSPRTKATYPVTWRVSVPGFGIDTEIQPLRDDQELAAEGREEIAYWEGAVRSSDGGAIGYLELTGYDKPIGPRL